MNRLFKWALLLCLGAIVLPAEAQDKQAEAIVKRYEQQIGADKLTPADLACIMTEVSVETQGVSMPMTIIAKQPDKMRMEMSTFGMKVLMVVSDEQGWVNAPGQGVQPMTPDMIAQLREQIASITQSYMLDRTMISKMVADVTENGKTYQGVEMNPPKEKPEVKSMVAYFDKDSGRMTHIMLEMQQGIQTVSLRTNLSDYKTFGNVTVPTRISVEAGGNLTMTMVVSKMQHGYGECKLNCVR